jgi:hypothetical protein
MNIEYVKQLEETIESLKRKLEKSEMRVEELNMQCKNLALEAPHFVPRKVGGDIVVGKTTIARSVGSCRDDGVIEYDLEIFNETLMGYVTTDMNNHLKEIDKWLRSGKMPKHADHRIYDE